MKQSTNKRIPAAGQTLALGLLPWATVWFGSYKLHSAVAAFVLYHLLCFIVWAANRRQIGPYQSNKLAKGACVLLAVAAVAIMGATYFVVPLLGWLLDPFHIRAVLAAQHIGSSTLDYAALFAYFALVNPVAEELFWRGTIYLRMQREDLSTPQAILASALLFGSWHWLIVRLFFPAGWAIVITLGIAAAGAIFATAFQRTRSVVFTILLHALAADVPVLIALWFGVLAKA